MASARVIRSDIFRFLELAASIPVVDVRSPSEFRAGHIPGAVNISLFDDREREAVGISYKKEGRLKAIVRGLELSGPAMSCKLKEAISLAQDGNLLVHCWRGGMRSDAMAWLFSLGDINVSVLEGGYKSYRHHVLECLSEKRKTIILGGLTGSSKTQILRHLGIAGYQVIDLEDIANHKGSAFGGLGMPNQPSSEHFSNLLFDSWRRMDKDIPVWLEDESRNIGSVFMPDLFFNNMQESPAIILIIDREKRLPGLIQEYSSYPKELLGEAVLKIKKRLGGDHATEALKAIGSGDISKAVDIVLKYYDKSYMHSISKKPQERIILLESGTADVGENAQRVLETARKIKW